MKKRFLLSLFLSATSLQASDILKEVEGVPTSTLSQGVSHSQAPQTVYGDICASLIDFQKKMAPQDEDQFGGSDAIDLKWIQDLRNFFSKDVRTAEARHTDLLLPKVEELKDFITQHPEGKTDVETRFLQEIDYRLEHKSVTIDWLYIVALRYLACKSDIQDDSLSVARSTFNSHYLDALLDKDSLSSGLSYLGFLGAQPKNNAMKEKYFFRNISEQAFDEIDSLISKKVFSFTLPLMGGKAKFGVPFLTAANWMDIYPVAVTYDSTRAHGTEFSPVEFALHDKFHEQLDSKHHALYSTVIARVDEHLENGGSATDIEKIIDAVINHYTALQSAMLGLQLKIAETYYDSDRETYSKIMNGAFWLTHEYPSVSGEDLEAESFPSVLTSLTSKVLGQFLEKESWENSQDPFETSPITGETKLSDQEITKKFFDEELMKETSVDFLQIIGYEDISFDDKREKIISHLDSTEVHRDGSRFIYVTFKFKNGLEKKYRYTTLYHKWRNLDDALGLLGMSGIKIDKPDLTEIEGAGQQRLAAQKTIDRVVGHLKDQIKLFETASLDLITQPFVGGKSIEQFYGESYDSTLQQLGQLKENISEKKDNFDFLK